MTESYLTASTCSARRFPQSFPTFVTYPGIHRTFEGNEFGLVVALPGSWLWPRGRQRSEVVVPPPSRELEVGSSRARWASF